jgi:hypothetical protein
MRGISAGFFLTFSLIAQTPAGDYSIAGSVVNNETGEPVRNALVTLTRVPGMEEIQHRQQNAQIWFPAQKTVLAGAGGEFQFTGLAEGEYNLAANKPGFNPFFATPSQPRSSIKITTSMSGVELKMAALGVIEGKVVDQFGEPVAHALINLYSVNINDGFRQIVSVRNVDTNDRGLYRLWNLAPGKYYVKAIGKNGGTYTYVGDSAPRYEAWEGFEPVYAGGARELDSATPIVIVAGTQAQADFNLKLEPAFKIRGTLQNYTQHQPVAFQLRQGSEPVANSRVALNGTTGRFEIEDVVEGSYVLRAMQGQATRGEIPVSVKDGDAKDISIALSPPVAVKGVVHYLGAPAKPRTKPPGGDDDDDGAEAPASCNVSLHEPGGTLDFGHAANAQSGNFAIENVFAGAYQVRLYCNGGYATSAAAGGIDLLANPNLLVQAGSPPPPIEINLKPGGGTLKAKVAVDPKPDQAAVLLIPAFAASTGPLLQGLFRFPGLSEDLAIELPNLAPGDYVAYALPQFQNVEFRNPTFLQSLTGGVSVRIEDGRTAEITISIIVK